MGAIRRKISLFATHRARNAGNDDSFLDPSNPHLIIPAGSDTESDSGKEEKAQAYLSRWVDDTERPVETVFGEGASVRRSMGGRMYVEIDEGMERQLRWEGEGGEEMGGDGFEKRKRKRKCGDGGRVARRREERRAAKKERMMDDVMEEEEEEEEENNNKKNAVSVGDDTLFPTLPPHLFIPLYPSLPAHIALSFNHPPSAASSTHPSSAPQPYQPRNPSTTHFHRSNAAIDPLGAHNRPIRPLPSRSQRSAAPTLPTAAPRRTILDSFGGLGQDMEVVDRFSERPYVLGQGVGGMAREEKVKEGGDGDTGGERKGNIFKGMSWLRR